MGTTRLHTVCTAPPPRSSSAMNTLVMMLAVAACASAQFIAAPVAYRAPSHNSAIIQSHRLGGNFAYSTHEAHAYGVQTPTHLVSHKIPQVVPYGAPFHYPYALG